MAYRIGNDPAPGSGLWFPIFADAIFARVGDPDRLGRIVPRIHHHADFPAPIVSRLPSDVTECGGAISRSAKLLSCSCHPIMRMYSNRMSTHRASDDPELRAVLDRLFSLQTFGIKLGLEPVTALLDEFGNPHRRFVSVHVAGTNGKGSVCAMVASVLQAAGLRVGLYTSPHLIDFEERIRVDGRPIDVERLARYAREMMPVIERIGCTFFEGTTAMGFRYFAEEEVDIAVVETGMGGRLDATNVLSPLVSAVTSISFDHVRHLGGTLEMIAREKAGIIKPGTPAVIGRTAPRLRDVFAERGAEVGAPVRFVHDFCRAVYHDMTFDGLDASFMIDGRELPHLRIGLTGRHQIENARVALGTLEQIRERFGLDERAIREGFGTIAARAGIRGRFQTVRNDPRTVIDVAHNADGARVLAETISTLNGGRRNVRIVYGAVQDKDVREIVEILRPLAATLYAVRADSHRSLPADEIAHQSREAGISTVLAEDVRAGVAMALRDAGPDEIVLICGSFFVVGEALEFFEASDGGAGVVHERGERLVVGTEPSENTTSNGTESLVEAAPADTHRSVREWHPNEQPRERLMKLGAKALSDAELLAILLRTGKKGEDVIRMSRKLLGLFENSFGRLASRDYKELQKINGIGPAKAVTLAAAFEIGRRIKIEPFNRRPTINGPKDVAALYIPLMRDISKEQFHVLILNTANQVVRMELISEGNLNSSIVHPREVYRTAIIENAASIIGVHNHPSGNPTPSKEDIAITRQLVDSGRILGIPFHDHVIIAGEEFVSLAERGYV